MNQRMVQAPAIGTSAALIGLGVICVGAAATIGYTIGEFGPLAAFGLPTIIVAILLATRPHVGLTMLAMALPLEAATLLSGGASLARLIGLVVAAGWILSKVVRRTGFGRVNQPLTIVCVLFVLYACISTIWGPYATSISHISLLVQSLGLTVITADLITTSDRLNGLLKALVIGSLTAAVLVVADYILHGVSRAGEGVTGGVNATARILATAVPFGFYLLCTKSPMRWRVIGLVYVVIAIVAVALTLSRSSFLMLAWIIPLYGAIMLRARSRVLSLALSALIALLLMSLLPADRIENRVATIGPYLSETVSRDPGEVSSSRGYHLRVALAIFQDNAILGAGYGNYGPLFLEYQWQLDGAGRIWRTPRSSHSSHLGLLADLGLVGICIWAAILALAFHCMGSAARAWRRLPLAPERLLLISILVSLISQLLYGFTSEVHTDKHFWMLLGLVLAASSLYGRGPGGPEMQVVRRLI